MDNFIDIFHQYIIYSVAILCLSNGVILFLRSRNNKATRTLSYVILLWGIIYLYRTIAFHINIFPVSYSIFRSNVLIIGIFFTFMMVLFPIQVLIPRWLNWKKMLMLFFPILMVSILYLGGMKLFQEEQEELTSYAEMWASITHFNVWFRFVILICNAGYIIGLLFWLNRFEQRYVTWKNNNYSDRDDIDISWLRLYNICIGLIFVCYISVELIGGKIPVLFHTIVVLFTFSYLFYKGLFFKSPYTEKQYTVNTTKQEVQVVEEQPLDSMLKEERRQEVIDSSFESKLPTYVETFKHWMDEEKPYLYKDFKLTDVSRILPLNRSYLSRIFNAGFGSNFSDVVRSYRVEYAKGVILKNPDIPTYQVASICGFNSDTTFIKAFKQATGVTPTQYKNKHIQEKAE